MNVYDYTSGSSRLVNRFVTHSKGGKTNNSSAVQHPSFGQTIATSPILTPQDLGSSARKTPQTHLFQLCELSVCPTSADMFCQKVVNTCISSSLSADIQYIYIIL